MSQTLIASLSQHDTDIEQLAQDFAFEFAGRPPSLHVELANLICYCCKVSSFPRRLIRNGDLEAVEGFLRQLFERSSKKTQTTINNLHSQKFWPNVLIFFHCLIDCEWDLLSGSSKFDSFFSKFLSMLTNAQIPVLRYFGTAVQLEFISVSTHEKVELLRSECRTIILEYTNNILLNSFHDYERKIWMHSLLQMRQWFRRNSLLLVDELLRYLVWSLNDRSAPNSYLSLQVAAELLEKHESNTSLMFFVESLLSLLNPEGFAIEDTNFFAIICELATVLNNKYPHLCGDFLEELYKYTFVPKRAKAKSAANVYLRTELRDLTKFEQLRRIVKFLASKNSVWIELFVDAMIDDCLLLTEWDTLADAFLELDDISEQETLLLVILCVANLMIDNVKPFIRDEGADIQPVGDVTAAMTSAFAPLLDTLSNENVSFRWKLFVYKLATYFDFDSIPKTRMAALLEQYINTLTSSDTIFDITQTTIILQLVVTILQHNEEYFNLLVNLKMLFEREFVKLAAQLHRCQPKKHFELMNVVIGMYALRPYIPLDEKCLLNVPMQLLHEEPESDSILLSLCREMALLFCSGYVEELLSNPESIASDEGRNVARVQNLKLVFHVFGDCLNNQFCSRLGQLVFFSLCRLVKALFTADVSDSERNFIFTETVSHYLCVYVALALGNLKFAQSRATFEFNSYTTENIIVHFSELILSDIIPLNCAYEFLRAYCRTSESDKWMRSFLLEVVERKSANEVAQWLLGYFAGYFSVDVENQLDELVRQAGRLSRLLKSMRSSMTNVMKYVHKIGIDFAVRRVTVRNGWQPVNFLSILAEFSPCLNNKNKEICLEYFRRKRIVGSVAVVKLYGSSLIVQKRRPVSFEDAESSSSAEGNESDVESGRSRPLFDDLSLTQSQSMSGDERFRRKRLRVDEVSSIMG